MSFALGIAAFAMTIVGLTLSALGERVDAGTDGTKLRTAAIGVSVVGLITAYLAGRFA